MLSQLRELFSLLTRQQRRRLLWLQLLIVVMSLAEIASVVAIGPFMAVVGDLGRLQGEGWLGRLYRVSGATSPESFLTLLGVAVLVVLLLSSLISMYTTWRLSLYSAHVGAELSSRLYRYYLHQPWLFHAEQSSSRLTHKASQEVQRVTQRIISPCLQLNARLVMLVLMTLAILLFNPAVAIVGVAIFVTAYLLLYRTVRRFLIVNGLRVSKAQAHRFKLLSEGFGGIKDLLLLHRQASFTRRFDRAGRRIARGQGVTQGLSDAPRYAIELVAFGSVILLVLYHLNLYAGDLGAILPALSIYALAGFKMLPAYQRIYSAVSTIRGHLASYDSIRDDLLASREVVDEGPAPPAEEAPWIPAREIRMQDVVFHYPGKEEPALDGLTLSIPANQMVALVGPSGSGKSTAVDLLLGLIQAERGSVMVDGTPVTPENLWRWQEGIGFVPQHIFLADATILENVAFGVERDEVDELRVVEALRMAQLEELVSRLPEGLETRVGERGVQLSGGQRQRIGIARALYRQARVLIFDEATSALDGITERRVMEDIQGFVGQMTIVLIAHRLATVRECDVIYLLEGGRVVDAGTYEELADRNVTFQMMANIQ